MTSSPTVSIVVPCYNAERWIQETLDSVFVQTFADFEVIVVNDGSTDGSLKVLERVTDPRLRVFSQENRGQTAALNRGLAEARGAYIQYLDADDLLHPEKLARQMERLKGQPGCIATAEWARFYGSPAEARFVPDGTWQDLAPVDWLVESWKDGGGMLFPALWLAPRDLIERIGPWREDLTLNNDAEYFTRLVLASKRVLFCAGARAYYRSGVPGSLSGLKSEAGWRSQWQVLEACERYLLSAEDSDRSRRSLAMLWQRFAHACYPYLPSLAEQAVRKGLSLHPVEASPGGGRAFHLVSKVLGWRIARRMQHAYYRRRYAKP
ncbi:MAG: glycosyltransferase [Holophagaceae bacterium]